MGTSKIILTSLTTSDTNNFWDAFNYEINASFIPTCFSSTTFFNVFIWVSNLNLSRSLLKSEDIAKVHDQHLLHATLLKAVFPLSEEFQRNLSVEFYHEYSWQSYQLLDKKFGGSVAWL